MDGKHHRQIQSSMATVNARNCNCIDPSAVAVKGASYPQSY